MSVIPTIDRLAVVVPARDEESALGGCLGAIRTAITRLHALAPEVQSVVLVVLDGCRDGSAAVLETHPGVRKIETDARMVGAARRLGVAAAFDHLGGSPASCWIACTDADSLVPRNWLVTQLALARRGAELVLGTVRPDRKHLSRSSFNEWRRRNPEHEGHPYVHGANLGIRGDAYLRAGGFPVVPQHEDVLLAAAVRGAGGRVTSTASCPVVTSGRTTGRTPGGFAGYLAALVQ